MFKAGGVYVDLFKQCENCKFSEMDDKSKKPMCTHQFGPCFFMFTCKRKKFIVGEPKAA